MTLPAPLPAPLREALATEVRRAFGLTFTPARYENLELGLHLAANAFPEHDVGALLGRLERAEVEAQQAVVTQLVVNETYFFRHTAHFNLLRAALGRWRDAGDKTPRRIWSAGCSTGEEPYSMAIAALETMGPHAEDVVSVLGTDISPAALARAEAGLYDEWSFREVPDEVRARWFTREEGRYRVRDEVRALVRFEPRNLLPGGAVAVGSPLCWPGGMDVVFCRNVLIYFDTEGVSQVGEALGRALLSDGFLIPGPADPRIVCETLAPVLVDDVLIYRLRSAVAAATPPALKPSRALPEQEAEHLPSAPPARKLERPPLSRPREKKPLREISLAPPPAPPPSEPPPATDLTDARRLADAGNLPAALELLDSIVEADPCDAEAHVLRAVVLQGLSDHARAVVDAERAILIDRSAPMPHVLAAVSWERLGQMAEAQKSLRNAQKLLAGPGGGARAEEARAAANQLARVLAAAPRRRG